MRLLLDTGTFLWLAADAARLTPRAPSAVHEGLLPPHHRDPFDRGLIAQAIVNGMTLVTPDPLIARYPVPILW